MKKDFEQPIDLLKCTTIDKHLIAHDSKTIITTIAKFVAMIPMSMGLNVDEKRILFLANELFDEFKSCSIEDIRDALKAGRRGVYDTGFAKRDRLSFELLQHWMKCHLTYKARLMRIATENERHAQIASDCKTIGEIYDRMKVEIPPVTHTEPKDHPWGDEFQRKRDEYIEQRSKTSKV